MTSSSELPCNFTEMDDEVHAEIWRRGIAIAVDLFGPYAGATLARHASELGGDSNPDKSAEFSEVTASLLREAFPDADPVVRHWKLERAFRVLRFCDLLTLAPCAGWSQPLREHLVAENSELVEVALEEREPFVLAIEPWPFVAKRVEVRVPVAVLGNEGEWAARREAFLAGEREKQLLVLVPR